MAGLRVGGKTPSKIYYGRASVRQVYYGAARVWPEIPAWDYGRYYSLGDVVEYEGGVYRCIQYHKSGIQHTPIVQWLWIPI
ncbi:carbohydrate-binding protein [Corynebacterium diphtheriae]|uniref:carbohydrate-binding protein n=1 Tax=Corynebacterium diphtheriae TaxID=1717 RepID=UPI000934AB20